MAAIVENKCHVCALEYYLPRVSWGIFGILSCLIKGFPLKCSACGSLVHYFCLEGRGLARKRPYICKVCFKRKEAQNLTKIR